MQASDAPVVDIDLRSFSKNGTAILGQIKITLSRAETLALVGPSGIGKTSLLRIIAGIEKGFEGDRRVKGKIAMVFQEPTLLPWRTVRDNITIPTGVDARTAEDALADVGLAGRGSDYPGQLSLGQQRRLSLARAFAVKPTLLLLDEPTGDLDTRSTDTVMKILNDLNKKEKITMIMVTHDVSLKYFADRVVRMGDGKVVRIDTINPQSKARIVEELEGRCRANAQGLGVGQLTIREGIPAQEIEKSNRAQTPNNFKCLLQDNRTAMTAVREPSAYPILAERFTN